MKQVLRLAFHDSSWNDIPQDIRTAREKFGLDPVTITFATCPACSSLYALTEISGKTTYPVRCAFKRFPTSSACNARLTEVGIERGVGVRVPVRPYIMQSFTDFAGKLYSRPGVEDLIRRT